MEVSSFFPIWGRLTPGQQAALSAAAFSRRVHRGDVIHNADADCTGLLLIQSGNEQIIIISCYPDYSRKKGTGAGNYPD